MQNDKKDRGAGELALLGCILVACIFMILMSSRADAKPRWEHATHKTHGHCYKHTHSHEQGSNYHDRDRYVFELWEVLQIPRAPTIQWEITDAPVFTARVGKRHKHCLRHKHSHINSSSYHRSRGDWLQVRVR